MATTRALVVDAASSDRSVEKSPSHVLVTGYFDRGNLGDDLFKDVWLYIFSKPAFKRRFTPTFVTADDLKVCERRGFDVILLAGGDILNYYFLTQIQSFIKRIAFQGTLCAFSVGIPYITIVADGLLDPFNFVMCRAKPDYRLLQTRWAAMKPNTRVGYFPDISCYLKEPTFQDFSEWGQERQLVMHPHSVGYKVGVFLTRTIHQKNTHYQSVVQGIARSLDTIASRMKAHVYLIPFNTFHANPNEDDRLINSDVYEACTEQRYVHLIEKPLSVTGMYSIVSDLDFIVAMRYHSHMYAIVAQIPLVSISITPKVENLMRDAELLPYMYRPPLTSEGQPSSFEPEMFLEIFERGVADKERIWSLESAYVSAGGPIPDFESKLLEVLSKKPQSRLTTPSPTNNIKDVMKQLVRYIFTYNNEIVTDADVALVTEEMYKGNVRILDLVRRHPTHTTWSTKERTKMGDFLAALACFSLVHIPYPKYHFGMSKKVLRDDFDARADFTWVWTDNSKSRLLAVDDGKLASRTAMHRPLFDATFVGIEDFKGCHRSGWQFVLDHLLSAFHQDKVPLILDNYLDRTFHWAHDVYEYTGIIPFPRPWCGFVHHTFHQGFSPFNVQEMFNKETFLASLANCKALFTLSHDLAEKVKTKLAEKGFPDVPVQAFVHPTESGKLDFSLDRFIRNKDRKVIMIGAWLRDNFAIYRMTPHEDVDDPDRVSVRKAILRGRNMSNYFKPTDLALAMTGANQDEDDTLFVYRFDEAGVPAFTDNKFALGLMRAIDQAWNSVTEISTLSNDDYDQLLSENIVFLKLVDASAVNTIIECIVRKTPVLVNRLPAVEEMLGSDYPFYYNGLTEAGGKVNHVPTIVKTVAYLSSLDLTRFKMEHFLSEVEEWFATHSLSINSDSDSDVYKGTSHPRK